MSDRKREGNPASLSSIPPPKKMKVTVPGRSAVVPGSSMPSVLPIDRTSSPGIEPWELMALDCEASELFELVSNQIIAGNMDKAAQYILGAIRSLRNQRFKPCKMQYNSLLLICQCRPTVYTNEHILNAMISSLRKDIVATKATNKGNIYNQILFINILLHAFDDVAHWPEMFLKVNKLNIILFFF